MTLWLHLYRIRSRIPNTYGIHGRIVLQTCLIQPFLHRQQQDTMLIGGVAFHTLHDRISLTVMRHFGIPHDFHMRYHMTTFPVHSDESQIKIIKILKNEPQRRHMQHSPFGLLFKAIRFSFPIIKAGRKRLHLDRNLFFHKIRCWRKVYMLLADQLAMFFQFARRDIQPFIMRRQIQPVELQRKALQYLIANSYIHFLIRVGIDTDLQRRRSQILFFLLQQIDSGVVRITPDSLPK